MSATLAQAKTALRIETSDHDARITQFLDAANMTVAEASGVSDWTGHPNLTTAAIMLTAHWFDAPEADGVRDALPAPVRALIDLSRTGWVKA